MSGEGTHSTPRSVLARIGRNTGWLLGGKGFAAVLSLAYLAIAARALGPAGFGVFALILTYAQAVTNLVQFRSWQTLIRFGAGHLAEERRDKLSRLVMFSGMLDLGGAVLGVLVAVLGVPLLAGLFEWGEVEQRQATLFGISLLFAVRSTPVGVLRLFDRFDAATLAETAQPIVRFAGALTAFALDASVTGYLIAWAVAEFVTSLALWAIAIRELRRNKIPLRPGPAWFKTVVAENAGLWRFAWFTNFTSSIQLVWKQVGTLVIGAVASPAIAGGFRLSNQLSQALAKPVVQLSRAGYPEFAHLVSRRDRALKPVLIRAGLITVGAALVLIAAVSLFGGAIITLVAGEEYLFARPYFTLLAIAVAVELAGVILEPLLLAYGKAGQAFFARLAAALVYVAAMAGLVVLAGPIGVAGAAVIGAAAMGLFLGYAVWRAARRAAQGH